MLTMYRTNVDLGPDIRAKYKISNELINCLLGNLYNGPDDNPSFNWSKGLARMRDILDDIPELYYNAETGELLEASALEDLTDLYPDAINWVNTKVEVLGRELAAYV